MLPRRFLLILTLLGSVLGVEAQSTQPKPEVILDPRLVPTPFIMSLGAAAPQQMAGHLITINPSYGYENALELARIYLKESAVEGVNADIAFSQMLLETNYLRFGGQVSAAQFNFAGMGALDGGASGLQFPDKETGVKAQIQHLKAYGSRLDLRENLVNPRFPLVRRASALVVDDLSRKWASDPEYGRKILFIAGRILAWKV